MRVFLWTVIALLALTTFGKLMMLAKGDMPRRTPMSEAFDVAANGALLVWAAVLLADA